MTLFRRREARVRSLGRGPWRPGRLSAIFAVVVGVVSMTVIPADIASAVEMPDLPEIARVNDKTIEEVNEILADATARVDATGRIFFVDRQPPAPSSASTPAAGPYPYAQTFTLHSRPGAQRTIYLDFNGETIQNTAWNGQFGAPAGPFFAEPFSIDGTATFSNSEQDVIQSVWQRVSEDFAPFDIDVTTQDPGAAAITRSGAADAVYGTRALVTDATEIAGTCGCGGIAYVGTFDEAANHAFYQPAFVFAPAQFDDAKNIAEGVSHEVGHNLGLHHDGRTAAGEEYYEGQGSWAPIMGGSYSRPISQWSKGEYTDASNAESDLDVIPGNGGPLLADDHGNTSAAATALGSGPSVTATGLITTDADIDVFKVDAAAGAATFSATPAPVSPNLDIQLQLRNSAGTILVTANPASATVNSDVASGLNASISTTLPTAGSYYLFVSGVGAGSAATTGYSGYASIGRYSLSGTVSSGGPTVSINDAPAVTEGPSGVNATATFTLTLSASSPSTVTVLAATANGTATAGSDYTAVSSVVSFPAGTTSKPFPVTVIGDATVEPTETFTVNLTTPVGVTLGDAQGVATITNDDVGPPVNNNFSAATIVSGLNGTINGTNVAATKEVSEPNHAGQTGGKSVWYRWTAPAAGSVTVDTFGSGFNTVLGIYTGTAVNALTPVASNDDSGGVQSKATFTATTNVVYRIAVDGKSAASGAVKLNWVQVPANNNFAAAAAPVGPNGTVTGTNVGANKEAGEPNHAGLPGGKSVWYRWTAPAAGAVTFDTFGSTFDTVLGVYTGTTVGALTPVTSNNDSGGLQSKVTFTATAGVTYRLAVDGNGAASGAITIHWLQKNDNFLAGTNLTGASGTINGTTVGATKEVGEPNHAGSPGGRSIWFKWTAPTTGTKTFDTMGSGYDTTLGVYTGTAVNALTLVANNDDISARDLDSRVTFPVTAGVTYRIAVDGYGGASGTVKLNWS